MSEDDDFSFSSKKDVGDEVDKLLKKKTEEEKTEPVSLEKPALSRVKIANDIRTNPPEPGYMKVDVPPKIYSIDLNIDAHWWFNHVCTVFPFLMDQAIRTHVDLKDSFKPEKRKLDFEYWWLLMIPIGIIIAVFITNMFFKIF